MLDEQTAATMSFVSGVHMRFIAGDRSIDSAEQLDLLLIGIADGIAAAYSKTRIVVIGLLSAAGPHAGSWDAERRAVLRGARRSPDAAKLGSGSAVPQLRLSLVGRQHRGICR